MSNFCIPEDDLIDSNGEFLHPRKQFKNEGINIRDYFQEVKRVIFIDISALHGCLPNIHDLSIHSKNNKGCKTKFNSHFDAWIIVLGK